MGTVTIFTAGGDDGGSGDGESEGEGLEEGEAAVVVKPADGVGVEEADSGSLKLP